MLRFIGSELRHRRGRTFALLAGILVATTSFIVLSGASQTGRLHVRGTVARHFRTAYDILVRPSGARSRVERNQDLVRPGVLSGIFGGITLAQWHTVLHTPGVDVAAPIATIGYALPDGALPIELTRALGRRERALFRVRIERITDRGLTRQADAPLYVYVTRRPLHSTHAAIDPSAPAEWAPRERLADGRSQKVCAESATSNGPFDPAARSDELGDVACWSLQTGLQEPGTVTKFPPFAPFARRHAGALVPSHVPFVIAAIDPAQEARLDGLDRAVIAGRYLHRLDHPRIAHGQLVPQVPVLAPRRAYADEGVEATVERLPGAAAQRLVTGEPVLGARLRRFLARQPGRVLRRVGFDSESVQRALLASLAGRAGYRPAVTSYWSVSATKYETGTDGTLVPRTVHNPPTVWLSEDGYFPAPLSAQDPQFRRLVEHPSNITGGIFPALRSVGTFDPARLPGFVHPLRSPLQSYLAPGLAGADPRSRRLLGDRPLLPNGNIAGYLTQPPLMLTTLRSLPAFEGGNFPNSAGRAPISAIRVRVAGVQGIDAVSRERVRIAAQRIARRTGLDVDLTIGSSPAPLTIALPAGRHGRPALRLTEPWTKKGVALEILAAVDRKSLILFALILVVCALSVANAVGAAVRARTTELGVLACVGWSTARLFALILGEVAAIGLVAGILGGAIAVPIAALVGVQTSLTRAALAIPAALILALVAGAVPAWRAAGTEPAAAVRPAVSEARRGSRPRSVAHLAVINARRAPGRSAMGLISVAVGVGALTLLLGAAVAFRDTLVGSLLGDAVSVQVRPSDYVAVTAIVVLGAAAVADVLYLGLRDRAAELATLRATGWDDRALGRLIGCEGLAIGAAGSLVGGAIGLVATAVFAGSLPGRLLLTTVAAVAVGTLCATVAAGAPAAGLRRMPAVQVLQGE